ncbi:Transcriptional regulator, IclR family [Devosia sp. LC5]|uniref:IclR family transcriptional regulator domain-containing protein n=1 Tax=Devosia sp. LC5 TaxID=1502724 RepID=UPI0004E3DAD7|nr:IclR family transcriptional regulator C-terminal domain-containing protein [Devosia sp. LC5]KFC67393.1 Transcriptional regulator, IclR family [Devosia sp. LC5]
MDMRRLDADDKEVSLTFAKGLEVICAFDGKNRVLTMAEVAQKTNLSRAVARRLVRTLEQLGYLASDRGRYELTPHVLRLTQGFVEGRGISQIIQPILRLASDEVGEAVSFSMLDDTEAVYVAHSYGPARFTLNMVTTGSRIPLLPTAAGRAMLAFLDAETRDAIIADAPLTAHTAHTETSKDKLIAQLGAIRAKGYCFADAEYVEGVDSLAVPVFGAGGKVIGAISIIFPQSRYQPEHIELVMFPKLRQCAADIGLTF